MSFHGFNLLQDAVRPADSWDKINEWVTNVGRIIVMVVELVVIVSFAARVVIDTQTKNLTEREAVNAQALAAFKDRELNFRDKQQRFENYKTMWDGASSYATIVQDVASPLPAGVTDLNIAISGNLISISGEASANEVRNFENRLKGSNKYADVQVVELEQVISGGQVSSSGRFTFGIRILVKEEDLAQRQKFTPTTTTTTNPTNTTNTTTQ